MIPKTGKTNQTRDLYSIKDVAHRLSITTKKVYMLVAEGKLRTVYIGSRRLIPADVLAAFIADLPSERPERETAASAA